ncbi:MAG: hypothetical protein KIS66_14375 [Fimbriimonadaceae bacterium]|nr:hypothetical protein [Fimbriimonadaceae bacterium]
MAKPRPFFGPGLLVSLLAAAGALAFGVLGRSPGPGPVAPQRPVASTKPPPLRKPEPGELLRLDLSSEQEARVRALDADWRRERAALESAMSAASSPARDGKRTLEQLRAGLQDYAALSRRYDAVRQEHWNASLRVLTPAQLREIETP